MHSGTNYLAQGVVLYRGIRTSVALMAVIQRTGVEGMQRRQKKMTANYRTYIYSLILLITPQQMFAAAAAKSLQSCLTLCDPRDGSPPGSPVPGILQASTLEWVAISFSNAWKWKVKVKSLSGVQLLATPWTAAYQAPPSMEFSRQEYWRAMSMFIESLMIWRHR